MRTLIVLDTFDNEVHYYKVDDHVKVNDEYVSNLGYNLNDCSWACGKLDIISHKGILT